MSDDPRALDRERPFRRGFYDEYEDFGPDITQVDERVKQHLSPADDEDPFAQAVRSKEEMDRNAASYRKLRLRRQKGIEMLPDVPASRERASDA